MNIKHEAVGNFRDFTHSKDGVRPLKLNCDVCGEDQSTYMKISKGDNISILLCSNCLHNFIEEIKELWVKAYTKDNPIKIFSADYFMMEHKTS